MPAELTLDHRFPGMVSVFVEAGERAPRPSRWASWYRDEYLPSVLPGSPGRRPCWRSARCRCWRTLPETCPVTTRPSSDCCCCSSSTRRPPESWEAVFAAKATRSAATGLGRVLWASPFIGTVPGTDTYTDQLW